MKKVYQTNLGPRGDCFAACIATITEIPQNLFPDFWGDASSPIPAARTWLEENFGYTIVTTCGPLSPSRKLVIAGGRSTFRNGLHAVVGIIEQEGFVTTHDPNTVSKGLKGDPTHYYYIVPIDGRIAITSYWRRCIWCHSSFIPSKSIHEKVCSRECGLEVTARANH